MRLRQAAALAALPLGAALLTGCEKPAPAVTTFSGSTSATVEAICWSFDVSEPVDAKTCLAQQEGQSVGELADELQSKIGVIPVAADQTIGISVDPELKEGGWFPIIGDSRLTADPVTSTYYRFQLTAAELRSGPIELRVLALGETPDQIRGLWTFKLQPADGDGTSTTPVPSPKPTKSTS